MTTGHIGGDGSAPRRLNRYVVATINLTVQDY